MSENGTNGNHESNGHGPNVPVISLEAYRMAKQYGDTLSKSVRHIGDYSSEDLETKGIVKGGKVQAENLWSYVNHLTESLLANHGLDAKDPRWKASFPAVKAVVSQYGRQGITTDLMEAVLATYLNTATQYTAERDQQLVASLPTEQGKQGVKVLAHITGNGVTYGPAIKNATDPTDVANIKGQLETNIRETVNRAIATGTLDELVAQAEHDAHNHIDKAA